MWIIEVSVCVLYVSVGLVPCDGMSVYVWAAWINLHKACFHMSSGKNKGPSRDPLYFP